MDADRYSKVLILFAHPAIRRSKVNRRLLKAIGDLEGVTINDLYEAYPDLDIDVEREQGLLLRHDVVVLQHPFYWYSTPAILKEWQDLVLEHGWAYGHQGHALEGKIMLSAITTGGSEETYCAKGSNQYTIRQLLAPIEHTARLCGIVYLPPFVVHGTHSLTEDSIEVHAREYRRLVAGLCDRRVAIEKAEGLARINSDLEMLLET
jgi:glutathione-regulated potassium-efflux system ancillary protein KefG